MATFTIDTDNNITAFAAPDLGDPPMLVKYSAIWSYRLLSNRIIARARTKRPENVIITGHMYGVTVQGSTCPVSVNTSQSFPGYPFNTGGGIPTLDVLTADEETGVTAYFSPTTVATDVVTWIQYGCMAPSYGSLTTQLLHSEGALSTANLSPMLNTAIYDIGETHTITGGGSSQTGIVYGMGDPTSSDTWVAADAAHFRAKVIDWGDWWLPPGSSIAICNTAAWYEPEAFYPYNPSPNATNLYLGTPEGCINFTLP